MATSDHDFKYDGQVTITLALHDDEISVWPSNELKGGVAISLLDSEEPRTNVGIASPAEWDAFVAAGNAALGRPAPISTPLEERVAKAIQANIYERDAPTTEREEAVHLDGYAKGLREALAMVREQGPTVPRAGVAAALAPVLALHAQVAEECGEERTNAIELLLTAFDEARATLAAAGLWPVPTPVKETP